MSNFAFLKPEWPDVIDAATKAESYARVDPRGACFYARRSLELTVSWLYQNDPALKLPYQDNLSALIHEPTFKTTAGNAIFNKAVLITRLGNQAVHSHRPVTQFDALTSVRELFHVCFWLARTYARGVKPADGLAFDADLLPKSGASQPQTQDQLQKLAAQLAEKDTKLSALFADKESLSAQLEQARKEIAEIKKKNAATPDSHDYSEAETRDYFIDLLLKEAGWPLTEKRDREYPVTGMPNVPGKGFVDYVLWGDDGKPLAVVEAKRTRKSAQIGQQQAKLYADCLEAQFGRRPVIFYSNGYEHWLWDDAHYPPRAVQGFYKKDELELMIQRRQSRVKLATAPIDGKIVERYYQNRAIRHICEAFEKDHDRKALIVMATGAGKTRTVIALCDLLMRCNWAKRVLFLADRVALVNQAVKAFKVFLPQASPVNLVTEKDAQGRVFVSTYPTMMGLIEEATDGQRRFGSGHFDLIVIDEAHRSVYQKYGAIFRYFDSYLVGLTATPRDEVDRDTYHLFGLETGVPTDAYSLDEAVAAGYLVPPKAHSVPIKFVREGIRYDELSDEEKEHWESLDWGDRAAEDGDAPAEVLASEVNKQLFNEHTVDLMLQHLMQHGLKVDGGEKIGKTIVFAVNKEHAKFIARRFDHHYPQYKGEFARVIVHGEPYVQTLIDAFGAKDSRLPQIAISVDMLDTGIDVPEVVNLVFFKQVRSKTKFWQMVGRGTRLCKDLFGPGKDKECFYIFDYCQNLEFFSMKPETAEGSLGASLGKRIFKARLEVIVALDKATAGELDEDAPTDSELGQQLRAILRQEVAAMNVNNFVVRPERRLVEKYTQAESWFELNEEAVGELARKVAGLPTELDPEDEEAKRFDLLLLNLQLAVLKSEPGFERLRQQVIAIAGLLEEKSSIPMVQQQLAHIQEIQTDEWWKDITVGMLEQTRKRLRSLVKLIEKARRKPVYTDFEDEMGAETSIELTEFTSTDGFEKFREKARAFLREHQDELAIHKLRLNEPLTALDLAELERMLAESGVAKPEHIQKAKEESHGLGLFVRSLIGMDREAAKKAFGKFTQGKTLGANQIEFINLIIDHLTAHGAMEPALLYESPFTDLNPQGPEGVFKPSQVDELVAVLTEVRSRAVI